MLGCTVESVGFAGPHGLIVSAPENFVKIFGCDGPVIVGRWLPAGDDYVVY